MRVCRKGVRQKETKRIPRRFLILLLVSLCLLPATANAQTVALEGVTFDTAPAVVYAPIRTAANALGWSAEWDAEKKTLLFNGQAAPKTVSLKRLGNGSLLIAIRDLRELGASVLWSENTRETTVTSGSRSFTIVPGKKHVEVDLTRQQLRAWQGELLVLESRVSTGAGARGTPTGSFVAGPYKSRKHYSSLYNNAPMPYSVQVNGNIFIHGFRSVPNHPASHGCIRVPLSEGNPARWFYEWVSRGTPIRITGKWKPP